MSEDKLTGLEIIVFEDEEGDIEMELIDEFELDGVHYVALRPPLNLDGQIDDADEINFFSILSSDEEEEYVLIEETKLLQRLADLLEERLLAQA